MITENICPACKSKDYAVISVSSNDGYTYLHIYKAGGVNLAVCKDCGMVYLEARYLERLRKDD